MINASKVGLFLAFEVFLITIITDHPRGGLFYTRHTSKRSYKRSEERRMSVLKKGLIFLLLGITVLVAWLLFVPNEQPALNFSSKNKIELLARILDHRNANTIRKAGYGIPSDAEIRRVGGIDQLEMDGDLKWMVRVPSPDDNKILITSSTIIEGEKIDVAFSLDKEWGLLHVSYFHIEKDGTTNRVEVSDSQQTELLEKVQTALNHFVKKMEQELKP